MTEIILPPVRNTVRICKQITVLVIYKISSYINLCLTRPSTAFVVTVGFRLINFTFQIFTLFCSEVSVSYMSYIVELISINWAWIL